MHLAFIAAVLPALFACKDKEDDSGSTLEANIFLADTNNFTYTGDIDVGSFTTASATDIEICWDQVTEDIQCHALDPLLDIDNVGLVRFPHFTQADVEAGLSANSLQQSDISGYVERPTENAVTCANLSEFSFFGTSIDISVEYTEKGGTYMLMLAEGLEPGVGARMLTFLAPSEDSDVTRVDLGNGCGMLDFQADLHSLTPVSTPVDGPWVVDWSGLTRDGLGAPVTLENIDGVMLAFYSGMTATDLETQFFDLELIASQLYKWDLSGGTVIDLATPPTTGGTFPGFTGDGTWVFALTCSRCYNPAPIFITALEPQ